MYKKNGIVLPSIILLFVLFFLNSSAKQTQTGYLLEKDQQVAKEETGPHDGGGNTTGYSFFSSATDSKLVFRKRALHPGSAIGYHLQKQEEIYYILSGTGEMTMNGKTFTVSAGDAILTLPGSSHGLKQKGKDDLILIINYEKN